MTVGSLQQSPSLFHTRYGVPSDSTYTLGSIAQCVYLQTRSRVPEAKFWRCVEAVGTNVFNGGGLCDSEDWIDRL